MIEKLHAKFPNVHQSVVVSGPGWFERSYDVPDILNFYKSYFNIGYHLFLVPFRYRLIKGNINDVEKSTVAGKTHCYNMHQNKAQKVGLAKINCICKTIVNDKTHLTYRY